MHLTQEAAAPCRSAVFPCHSQVLWRPVQAASSQVTTHNTVTIVNNIMGISLQVFWAERVSGHLLAAQEASLLTVSDWQGDKYWQHYFRWRRIFISGLWSLGCKCMIYCVFCLEWIQIHRHQICTFKLLSHTVYIHTFKWRQLCELPNIIYNFSVLDIRVITNINKS